MADQPYNLEPVGEDDLNLEERFGKKKERPTSDAPTTEKKEQEISHENVLEKSFAERDQAYQKILKKVQGTPGQSAPPHDVQADADAMPTEGNRERQIEHLVDVALTKGVQHAVKVARHVEDYYVLDQLHDRLLADELHDALIEKGLLEQQ